MMTFEALFSLLALLAVISMLAQPQQECAVDEIYEQRLLQDVASVLAKRGMLDRIASAEDTPASVGSDLQQAADVSRRCVRVSIGAKVMQKCPDGAIAASAGEVYATKRIAVAENLFEEVLVEIWRGGQ